MRSFDVMKKVLTQLMTLCPGRLMIEIDRHKLFNETSEQVIRRKPSEYGIHADDMILRNTIIMVEAAPIHKAMPPAVSYHYDLEKALQDCLNQINLWQPKD